MERIGITIKYAIKRNGLYLQGIEINEKYEKTDIRIFDASVTFVIRKHRGYGCICSRKYRKQQHSGRNL